MSSSGISIEKALKNGAFSSHETIRTLHFFFNKQCVHDKINYVVNNAFDCVDT